MQCHRINIEGKLMDKERGREREEERRRRREEEKKEGGGEREKERGGRREGGGERKRGREREEERGRRREEKHWSLDQCTSPMRLLLCSAEKLQNTKLKFSEATFRAKLPLKLHSCSGL